MKKQKKTFSEIVPKEMLCQNCGIRVGQKLHDCPLSKVFPGDYDKCNCCEICEGECHDEV